MKWSKPPFSAASGVQSISVSARSRGTPSTPVITTPVGRTSATSPSSRKTIRFVWARIAATSLAMKLSSPWRPTTSGTSWRAPTSRLISPLVHDDERVGAVELAERRPDGVGEVALVGLLDEVGDRLGVGLGRQRVAARLEPVAELR